MFESIKNNGIYIPYRYSKKEKKGIVVKVKRPNGKIKTIRLYKNIPKGCSSPKRICIKCLVSVIHKLDNNYESKICKDCTLKMSEVES